MKRKIKTHFTNYFYQLVRGINHEFREKLPYCIDECATENSEGSRPGNFF